MYEDFQENLLILYRANRNFWLNRYKPRLLNSRLLEYFRVEIQSGRSTSRPANTQDSLMQVRIFLGSKLDGPTRAVWCRRKSFGGDGVRSKILVQYGDVPVRAGTVPHSQSYPLLAAKFIKRIKNQKGNHIRVRKRYLAKII